MARPGQIKIKDSCELSKRITREGYESSGLKTMDINRGVLTSRPNNRLERLDTRLSLSVY